MRHSEPPEQVATVKFTADHLAARLQAKLWLGYRK
jgi:hypothetical protein